MRDLFRKMLMLSALIGLVLVFSNVDANAQDIHEKRLEVPKVEKRTTMKAEIVIKESPKVGSMSKVTKFSAEEKVAYWESKTGQTIEEYHEYAKVLVNNEPNNLKAQSFMKRTEELLNLKQSLSNPQK